MRIGLVLEVTTSFQHFKYGIEIRIKSVNQDDSHSWVRISYGTVKYVIDSIEDNTENPADPQEEQISQASTSVVADRSKAKAKPQPRELDGTTTMLYKDILEAISLILRYRTIGCTLNLLSIINNGLILGGQNLSRRQTVFFLPVDPRNESHRDPEYIDFSVPRLARYMHKAW